MKKSGLFALFFVLLVLAGCTPSNQPPTTGAFVGGKEGVVTTLSIDSAKPNEVLDAGLEPFRINVNLQNKGEYSIQENELLTTLFGINERSFGLKDTTLKNPQALGKTRKDPQSKVIQGDQLPMSYESTFKEDLVGDQVFDVGVRTCYKYNTDAVTALCLRKNVLQRGEATDKCKIDEPKTVSSSGAPVQVTSLSERASGQNEVIISMVIENVGKGDVFDPAFLTKNKACVEDAETKNKVHIKVGFSDGQPAIQCPKLGNTGEGTVQMIQGKAILDCKINTNNEQDTTFTRSPNIQVTYVYKDAVFTKLTVRNAAA